ncbi:MAG: helix-turn-helix domain-containing protein, partial [Nitratireductor sp.]
LRERAEDIPDLVRHFFARAEQEGLQPKRIGSEGLNRLKNYRWPGNVRELENLVRRLAALYPQDEISAEIIEQELRAAGALRASQSEALSEETTLTQAVEQHLQRYFAQFGDQLPPAGLYQRVLADVEQPLLIAALTATGGNQLKAADLLGLNRNTLRKKIRDYGINIYRGAG